LQSGQRVAVKHVKLVVQVRLHIITPHAISAHTV
jgi:hypothetical protein